MAYALIHGPPAIDATHAYSPATVGVTAPPVLNARLTDPATLPWIKVKGVAGWNDLPEQITNSAGVTNGIGEVRYPPRILGRTLVYDCETRAADRESIALMRTAVLQGFGADLLALTQPEGVWTVTPYTAPGGIVWTYKGAVIDLKADPGWSYFELRRAPYRWAFQVTVRQSDPRFYSSATPSL